MVSTLTPVLNAYGISPLLQLKVLILILILWMIKRILTPSTTTTWTKSNVISHQSKFLHHEPCPHCGSSDALAKYSDGGAFCFSCRKLTRSNVSGFVLEAQKAAFRKETTGMLVPPDDIGYEYSKECVDWVGQYDLTAVDLIKNKVFWSHKFNQLLYLYPSYHRPGIGLIQGRNFTPGRTKYFNQGDVNDVLPIYHYAEPGEASILVLVEDAISAIKITKDLWVDAMPILGSSISLPKISKLAELKYRTIIVWLDRDKFKEADRICRQIQFAGPNSFVVSTDLDPKCYNSDIIARKLELMC